MLRIVFMGTPEFSVPALTALLGQGYEVVACYSQPPRKAGRGMAERKSAVHEAAERFAIPVFTPTSLKSAEAQETFRSHNADVAVVIAYGLLLPQEILDAPVHGCLNVHASLLPRWRGAAPINRAIMAGDTQTGVMVMKMDAGLDTGPIAMAEHVTISDTMTAGQLHDDLSRLGADLIVRAVGAIERGSLDFQAQSEDGVTYAHKLSKLESRIDWSKSANEISCHIRGLSPFPGAWFELDVKGNPQRIRVHAAQVKTQSGEPGVTLDDALTIGCGEGSIQLLTVQKAGKSAMDANAFLRGLPVRAGTRLG